MSERRLSVFYDGACPICAFEIDALKKRDACDRLHAIDISAPEFDAAQHGFRESALDAAIHVVDGAGVAVQGTEALRRIYRAVGLGWLVAPTAWPGCRALADLGYRAFARHRRGISGAVAALGALLPHGTRRERR